ncbi:MAG TPA: flagellar hook-basal body complex protein [Candidatus Baltobacteraceae bacterium]|jgi:flagellar basal-body rod protein FlgG|nr:flagellar hook-basal body complex protein [Candidatus Baltobacteraceae bacterium]
MNRALWAAATGMAAQQQNLDVITQNLANADVAGFKGAFASFTDIAGPGGTLGTQSAAVRTFFNQGRLVHSGGPFDVAIDGPGFFAVHDSRGRRAYTRNGEFSRSSDGTLRNAQGWRLDGVRIPSGATGVTVRDDGTVTVQAGGSSKTCGHIRLAQFAAPDALESSGGTLFYATPSSGKPHFVAPGTPHGPSLAFGSLEQSNVTIVEAMMEILAAQRAYEANAKGVQAADEMMRIADNLSRS